MRRYIMLFGLCLSSLSHASVGTSQVNERDLYFGEAYYYAYLDEYVDAVPRLDIANEKFYGPGKPNLDPLYFQFGYSRFSVGDFELSYRMPQRAERAIKAIFENNADQSVRNEAAYRLARIYFQNGEPEVALQIIEKISGMIPEIIREDEPFLRSQIYMANGKLAEAVEILQKLQNAKSYKGFTAYNLGVALIKIGQDKQGIAQLDRAGRISGNDDVTQAIKDKANLTLGSLMIDAKQPELAKQYLERIRVTGPYSNKALLGLGWADIAVGRFESALAPWSVLSKRNVTDNSVQESMLGVPYAYSKLNLQGKAAVLYDKALDGFEKELNRQDESIKSVREGKFLQALLHEDLKQDKDWISRLRALPDTPETRYLLELLSSNDFQESLKNYLDLSTLLNKLDSSDVYLNSFEETIGLRRQYYQSQLPTIDKQFSDLDSQLKSQLKERNGLEDKIKNIPGSLKPGYSDILANAYIYLQQMDDDVKNLKKTYASFVSLRQSVTQNYQGYDDQIRQLKDRVRDSRQKVSALMTRQGQMLEAMAINELNLRRKHLQDNQTHARFALAENYERAGKMQAPSSGVK